ncbi:paired box protein and transposase domain containing protein [Lasius niger]|uniref:Paired box protein and transposase domain containing protein n=1 Tax=Lasius niger TaxID=67767 RepID=A0A0J7K0I8_LASNI|nr:paired box protein and transposase domain containing protein [Lasius niger]
MALHQEGRTERYIASKLKVSKTAVHNTIVRKRETGSLADRVRSGRPKATTSAEDRRIITMSKRNRRMTASEICAEINESRENRVCVTTVKNRLLEHGLRGCVAVRKPLLRKVNKVKRLEWAKKHRDWAFEDWAKVLWTDESKFEVFGLKRRVFVRRTPKEKMLPDCVVPTVKHGGGSVIVWGSFCAAGVGNIVKIDGIHKKEQYKIILQQHAIPSGERLIGKPFVLQQDNDPKHFSKLC